MPDALTESFCERCGTRYEFAAPARLTPLRRTRGFVSGLKNYIMSQDSLTDSIGDGMRSQTEVLANRQLDAFHASFNFCIDCRQYTCTSCWNDAAGRCQSCQPLPEIERLTRQFEATVGEVQPDLGMPFELARENRAASFAEEAAWPATDLTEPAFVPLLTAVQPEPVLVEAEAEPEPDPMLVEAEAEPEPVLVEAEPEPEAEVEPEPIPYPPLRPISDTFLHFPRSVPDSQEVAAAAAGDDTLAARRSQLDLLGLGDPGQGPVVPTRPVVLPYRSGGAAPRDADLAVTAPSADGGAFWDASAREVAGVISQVGVRNCGQCELSLSATARFCRRCGTPQSQSA